MLVKLELGRKTRATKRESRTKSQILLPWGSLMHEDPVKHPMCGRLTT